MRSYGRKNGSNYVKKCGKGAPSRQYNIYCLIEKKGSFVGANSLYKEYYNNSELII